MFPKRTIPFVVGVGLLTPVAVFACASRSESLALERSAVELYKSGNLSASIAKLEEATRECPTSGLFRFMLGNALYRANQIDAARESYQRAVELDSTQVEWRVSLGFTLFELGDTQGATRQWVAAISLAPGSALSRAAAAVGLSARGDRSNALIQYQEAIRLEPRYADPDALAIDIRWKASARKVLTDLKRPSGGSQS